MYIQRDQNALTIYMTCYSTCVDVALRNFIESPITLKSRYHRCPWVHDLVTFKYIQNRCIRSENLRREYSEKQYSAPEYLSHVQTIPKPCKQ